MDDAQKAKFARTLLDTISAFGEEAPDFEEAGVEEFQCLDVTPVGPGLDQRMIVLIDRASFVVTVHPE